jgi:hypothetical protein
MRDRIQQFTHKFPVRATRARKPALYAAGRSAGADRLVRSVCAMQLP